jgi:hypothetical protein
MNKSDRQPRLRVGVLLIMSCVPVVVIIGTVLIIAGGFNASFAVPAIVIGVMVGLLTFVTQRDRHLNYPGGPLNASGTGPRL